MAGRENMTKQSDAHYAVQVTNMPPTEIICKCGARFVGGDVIQKQKDHMDTERPGK